MKTIFQILPSLDNTGGGVERGTLDIAKHLQEIGYKSVIISSGGDMSEKYKHKGVIHYSLPLYKKNIFNIYNLRKKFKKILNELSPDLIHIRSRWPALCFNKVIKERGIPLVTTYHGTYSGNNNFLKKKYNSLMTEGDMVIGISRFIISHVAEFFPQSIKKLKLVNRGIDTKYFDLNAITRLRKENFLKSISIDEKKHIILLPARLSEWKGHKIAISAAASISRDHPELEFVMLFVGSNQGRKKYSSILEKQIVKLSLQNKIMFTGNRNDMPSIYSIADVIISTSIEPEAFGRVSAEAGAMTKPIIATNLGGSKDIILNNQTGWLIKEKDPEELAKKIVKVIKMSQTDKDKVGNSARKRVIDNFGIKQMLDKETIIYDELIKRKHSYN